MHDDTERDFHGYGATPPDPRWPGGARIAININLNYEAGGEQCLLEGDGSSEMLTDISFPAYEGLRSPIVESAFEYGSRCGVWRLLRIFARFNVRVSVLAVVRAIERNPEVARAMIAAGHEIVSHGYRWLDYHGIPEAVERDHIAKAVANLTRLTGTRPLGWMTGRPGRHTRRLLAERGGFLYDRDSLGDELPYWVAVAGQPHLVVPYSYEMNDNRFDQNHASARPTISSPT
jgi:peptidoglycan/xylan/chitin deacetylase (PgdA/CDA1 family)